MGTSVVGQYQLSLLAGQYRVSGYKHSYEIVSIGNTPPENTEYIDTLIISNINDTIINVTIIDDTALTICDEECYNSPGGGPAYYFQSVANYSYFTQGVTFSQSSPDSIYITIWHEQNPATFNTTVLKGKKL